MTERARNGMSDVHGCTSSENGNPNMKANCSSLVELTLPIYSDCSTLFIGNFLKDLDIYFELKSVSEELKLPLAPHASYNLFANGWFVPSSTS